MVEPWHVPRTGTARRTSDPRSVIRTGAEAAERGTLPAVGPRNARAVKDMAARTLANDGLNRPAMSNAVRHWTDRDALGDLRGFPSVVPVDRSADRSCSSCPRTATWSGPPDATAPAGRSARCSDGRVEVRRAPLSDVWNAERSREHNLSTRNTRFLVLLGQPAVYRPTERWSTVDRSRPPYRAAICPRLRGTPSRFGGRAPMASSLHQRRSTLWPDQDACAC